MPRTSVRSNRALATSCRSCPPCTVRDATSSSYRSGYGKFLEAFDVAAPPDGSVYVVDDARDDILQFSADGAFTRTIGSHAMATAS